MLTESCKTKTGDNMSWHVSTFYSFQTLKEVDKHKVLWQLKAEQLGLVGLVIMGEEGFNLTVAAPTIENLSHFKAWVNHWYGHHEPIMFKDSKTEIQPFKKFRVKIRPEIVTLKQKELKVKSNYFHHLSPEEWDRVIEQEPDAVIIDTRNWYEYNIGTFKRALNPNIPKFSDFPAWFRQQNIEPSRKILIFCTGGIRCEKGIFDLYEAGYKNVYQLEGGILNYLEQRPHKNFIGECFVFDKRVALDQNLQATKIYGLCPRCGQPGAIVKECRVCGSSYHVCSEHENTPTCSKNCQYQWENHPHRYQNGPKRKKQSLSRLFLSKPNMKMNHSP